MEVSAGSASCSSALSSSSASILSSSSSSSEPSCASSSCSSDFLVLQRLVLVSRFCAIVLSIFLECCLVLQRLLVLRILFFRGCVISLFSLLCVFRILGLDLPLGFNALTVFRSWGVNLLLIFLAVCQSLGTLLSSAMSSDGAAVICISSSPLLLVRRFLCLRHRSSVFYILLLW